MPATVAWNCNDAPVSTEALAGATLTLSVGPLVDAAVGDITRVAVRVAARVAVTAVVDRVIVAVGVAVIIIGVVALGVAVRIVVGVRVASGVNERVVVAVGIGLDVAVRVATAVEVGWRVAVRLIVAVGVGVSARVKVRVAVARAMTARDSGADSAAGPGFATAMLADPTWVVVPVATRSTDDLNVVASGTPFHNTAAPLTKWLPTTWSVNGPFDSGFGVRLLSNGV